MSNNTLIFRVNITGIKKNKKTEIDFSQIIYFNYHKNVIVLANTSKNSRKLVLVLPISMLKTVASIKNFFKLSKLDQEL